jgi:hypothetical protein
MHADICIHIIQQNTKLNQQQTDAHEIDMVIELQQAAAGLLQR